jgi:2-polyprenyl-3-methyl-5-hydroxy-6-metoxy-1,4-benzoquinol methylase
MINLGKQVDGISPKFTKEMAFEALARAGLSSTIPRVADIGGGRGELTHLLAPRCDEVWLVDYSPPSQNDVPSNVTVLQRDLNRPWNLPDDHFDCVFSLECIEHIENPRHFMREMRRITKPNGYIFVSTPNNHSIFSKITFVILGQHRLFQKASYPAHLTAILKCDIERMAAENNLQIRAWIYSNCDTLPVVNIPIKLPGSHVSLSLGVLMRKLA